MTMKPLLGAFALVGLAACVTPVEDLPRAIEPLWQLTPDTTDMVTTSAGQGDIIMSWTANAFATHEMTRGGQSVPLVATETVRGKLYCDFSQDDVCYEDRDANGAFDQRWKVYRNPRAPGNLFNANSPSELETPIPFTAATNSDAIVLTQQVGLLYNGPVEGEADEDFVITNMLGEFMLGWHKGIDAPRDPSGLGWNGIRAIPILLVDELAQEVTVQPFNFTYRIIKATVEGDLDIVYQMQPVDSVGMSDKLDFDVNEEGTMDEDGETTRLAPQSATP